MRINRSNYEIWFIDWADNNLDQSQLDELNLFLDQNPDLKKEFDDIVELKLVNEDLTYTSKKNLRRSASELSPEQFEYLCIAFFENDLPEQQKADLIEIRSSDGEKAKTFEMMRQMRLKAPLLQYPGKKSLLRKTPFEKTIRVSWIILGAAAAVAAFMVVYPLLQKNVSLSGSAVTAEQIKKDSILIKVPQKIIQTVSETKADSSEYIADNLISAPADTKPEEINPSSVSTEKEVIRIQKVETPSFQSDIILADLNLRSSLIESRSDFKAPVEDDGRSNIGKFIARNFREKILRQKEVSDAPLKGYELAEAGIEGLNKLLGWQMALDTNTDVNGEVESVRFNSKMLKFSAPVKKSETGE